MRIAQLAHIRERVPPKKYGGAERVIFALTEELVRRGHEVTLFASGDSITSAGLISVYPKNLRELPSGDLYGMNLPEVHNIGTAYEMQDNFDLIHDHTFPWSLPAANIARTPVLYTMHGPIGRTESQLLRDLRRPHIASISKAQARFASGINYAGNVYHGFNMEHYPFSIQPDSYLLWVGRICMQKGVHYAIAAAQSLGLPLIIAGKLDSVDTAYYKTYVRPNLSGQIQWVGEVEEKQRNELMSKALAFLHPVTWPEPFGLTIIEAMACGCPVIGFNRGSIPELVIHGKTGFVVNDLDELVDAVLNLDKIKREDCRQYVLQNFTAARMADGYEKIYFEILDKVDKKKQLSLRNLRD